MSRRSPEQNKKSQQILQSAPQGCTPSLPPRVALPSCVPRLSRELPQHRFVPSVAPPRAASRPPAVPAGGAVPGSSPAPLCLPGFPHGRGSQGHPWVPRWVPRHGVTACPPSSHPATREGSPAVPWATALKGAWHPRSSGTVRDDVLKPAASQGKAPSIWAPRDRAGSCGRCWHHDRGRGHHVPTAGVTRVSPWSPLPGRCMANISHAAAPRVSPSRPRGLGSSSAGPGAGLGTRSRAASAAARSCAHLDFSRLRSTSLLNQMAKINK